MKKFLMALVLFAFACAAVIVWRQFQTGKSLQPRAALSIFAGAALKPPLGAVIENYKREYGGDIFVQYGASEGLLASIKVAQKGDLYLPADDSYLEKARETGILDESVPLARMSPVLAVAKNNPKHIRSLANLNSPDVRVVLASSAAAIGRVSRGLLRKSAEWPALQAKFEGANASVSELGTVTEVANSLKVRAADAGIIWDAVASQYPELEIVRVPLFDSVKLTVAAGILRCSSQPAAALRFARYLGARDKGLKEFARFHYETADGDDWAETPALVLFSGAMLRPGIEKTLKEFEQREGCQFTTVYNGCGILTAQMHAGERPDAYFSCENSFMSTVAGLYLSPIEVVDNNLMLIVAKGNPCGIRTPADLAKPGLRVGLPHHEKSAMGNIAWKMLVKMNLYDGICKNLKVESPTGDFLINQLRTGSLDAIIACRTNFISVREHLDGIAIDEPMAKMIQPFAVGRNSHYKQMMFRLQNALIAADSRKRFEEAGFAWRYPPPEQEEKNK